MSELDESLDFSEPPMRLDRYDLEKWYQPIDEIEDRSGRIFWMMRMLQTKTALTDVGILQYMVNHPLVKEKYPGRERQELMRILSKPEEEQIQLLRTHTLRECLAMPLPEIPELVENCVRIGDLTLLAGFGGVGKSTIALPLGLSLASGVPFLDFPIPSPEPVLYLDLEMGAHEISDRLTTLALSYPDIARDNFHYLSIPSENITSFKINVPEHRKRLEKTIELIEPKLLIVDNHARFHTGDENVAKDMIPMVVTPLTELMVKYDLGVFYIMHTGLKARDRPRGTVSIFDAASTVIAVTRYGLSDRMLEWTKNRSVRRAKGPTKVKIHYDHNTFLLERADAAGELMVSEALVILDPDGNGTVKESELAKWMQEKGKPHATAYRAINGLIADGAFQKQKGGILRYDLELRGE